MKTRASFPWSASVPVARAFNSARTRNDYENENDGNRTPLSLPPPWRVVVSTATLLLALLSAGQLNAQVASKPPTAGNAGHVLLPGFRAGPMRGVDDIVFAARALNQTDGHWYANFGYYA